MMKLNRIFVILPVYIACLEVAKDGEFTLANSGYFFNVTNRNDENDLECPVTTQNVHGIEITWDSLQAENSYAARPHCLDAGNMYVLQNCPTKEFNCHSTQNATISDCPDGYESRENLCVRILPREVYEKSRCDYAVDYVVLSEGVGPVWLPFKRSAAYGIGGFEPDGYHRNIDGVPLTEEAIASGIPGRDCLIYDPRGREVLAVNCSESYARVCAYEKLHVRTSYRYCDVLGGETNCHAVDFDQRVNKCFCFGCGLRACSLAEPRKPYQRPAFQTAALIGIEYDYSNAALVWKSDGQPVGYTNWAYEGLIPAEPKQYVALVKSAWILTTVKHSCALCDHHYQLNEPRIEISKLAGGYIEVTLNATGDFIIDSFGCRTDSSAGELITSAEIRVEQPGLYYTIIATASGNYWCESYGFKSVAKITSKKVFVAFENIYALEVSVKYADSENPLVSKTAFGYITQLNQFLSAKLRAEIALKWMKTLHVNQVDSIATYLVHVCVGFEYNHTEYFYELRGDLYGITDYPAWLVNTSNLFNLEFCAEQTLAINGSNLTWPVTPAGRSNYANRICLDARKEIVQRECIADNVEGARWSPVQNCSVLNEEPSAITQELLEILLQESNKNALEQVESVTKQMHSFAPIDVHIVAKILAKTLSDTADLARLSEVLSNVIDCDEAVLRKAQAATNSTDNILDVFDLHLVRNRANFAGKLIENKNIAVLPFNPHTSNITGFALVDLTHSYRVMLVYKGTSLEELAELAGLKAAVVIPDDLLEMATAEITLTLFLADSLFATRSSEYAVIAENIAILLPEIANLSSYQIPILFKPNVKLAKRLRKCAFWAYGGAKKGEWALESTPEKLNGLLLCKHNHVTHFGVLLSDQISQYDEVLTIASYVGFSFSMVGICGIFLTAALFENWRQHDGNKVIIHYGIVSVVQIIFLHISYQFQEDYAKTYCVFVGAVLHYTVLCQFLWMFNMAHFMYKRYVQVLHGPTIWIFRQACLVSYALPFIPVLILVTFFQNSYTEGTAGICYPTTAGLLYSILLPIGVIMAANIFIFLAIFYELFCKDRIMKDDTFGLRLRLVVLVFFMTGMTWGFGFFALMVESLWLEFAFCFTTSLQGFVLFLFFIVLNENTRIMYAYIFRKYSWSNFYR